MNAWIIKTETYDPKLALEIVADQRTKGYSAWIEDEHGKAVDEEAFRMNQTKPTKTTLREKGMTRCFFWHPQWLPSVFFMWPVCGVWPRTLGGDGQRRGHEQRLLWGERRRSDWELNKRS